MKIEDWRKEIDVIDSEIINLIARRARIVRKIGILKANAGLEITDVQREKEILRRISKKIDGLSEKESVLKIFQLIIQESKFIQKKTISQLSSQKLEVCQ